MAGATETQETLPQVQAERDNFRRRYEALSRSIEKLLERHKGFEQAIALLRAKVAAAQKNLAIQQDVVKQNLAQTAAEKQSMVDEILQLRQQIRDLGGEPPQ